MDVLFELRLLLDGGMGRMNYSLNTVADAAVEEIERLRSILLELQGAKTGTSLERYCAYIRSTIQAGLEVAEEANDAIQK